MPDPSHRGRVWLHSLQMIVFIRNHKKLIMLLHHINPRDITNMAEPKDEHDESICGAEKRDRQILSTDDAQNVLTTLRTQECLFVRTQNVM